MPETVRLSGEEPERPQHEGLFLEPDWPPDDEASYPFDGGG